MEVEILFEILTVILLLTLTSSSDFKIIISTKKQIDTSCCFCLNLVEFK